MGMGIPQEDADRIVRLYTEEHCYYDKIATATGYSKDEIRRCLYDRGVLLSHSHLGNPLPYDVLYDEYVTQGKSANRIAEEHGVTKATVLKWLRILEIPVRTPPNASGVNIDTDTLRQAYVYEHRDVKGLAQQAHCSAEALSRHIKRLGLDIERQEHRDSIIREGIQNGHSPLRISNDSGIPYGHVRKRCKELRLTTPSQRSMERAASLDRERAVSLYTDEGKSAQQIAEQLQVPYSAVYRVLREEHVEMRPSHQHAAVDVGKLSKRYLEDRAGYAEFTAEFGISPIALNRILRANGIALRRDVRHAEKWDDDTFPEFIRWACEVNGDRLTVPEVADYFDVTEAAVRHKAHALGLESCFCQHCSAPELHWMRWLDSQGLSYENNARTVISPQEIDLYLPEFRLGLEINPTYTHSVDIQAFGDQSHRMTIGYHQAKSRRAEEAGVRLIHVFDWDDESTIRDLVLNVCRRNEVVYARNTTVRPVSKQDEAWFMRQNHLHGHVPSVCCYGLYGGDGRLLMAMSFGRPRYDNVERAE